MNDSFCFDFLLISKFVSKFSLLWSIYSIQFNLIKFAHLNSCVRIVVNNIIFLYIFFLHQVLSHLTGLWHLFWLSKLVPGTCLFLVIRVTSVKSYNYIAVNIY